MLKFLPLFWANVRRKPVRTGLTIASIMVAFLLFGLLKTMQGALELGADLAGIDRLATMHKVSLIQSFPLSYLNRIRAVDGVVAATSFNWFGGVYQDERNQIAAMTTEPVTFFAVYPEYDMPPEQRADWIRDRASMIVGKTLAARFGWSVGDTVPVRSSFYRKDDGSNVWDLRVAGIYDAANGDNSSLYFHYDYLNEAVSGAARDSIGFVLLKIDNPDRAQQISATIDAMFANSPAETKTSTERAFVQSFANQMGDIATIVTVIATAVFFTMLLVTANTMAQSVRERISEIAVLKTLGYSKRVVATLVLAESLVITTIGGVAGLGLAALAADSLGDVLAQYFPVIGIPASAYVTGAVLIVVLSAIAALLPSVEAWRLRITDALRKA
jgi:putative ABC transport system permease protein